MQYEGIEDALMAALQQKATTGEIPLVAVAQIATLVLDDKVELMDAINKVTEQAAQDSAAQQQAQPPGPPESGAPGQPGAQALGAQGALSGLAGPQAGIAGATPGQQGLAQLFGALRGTRPLPQTKAG
jgi:hypothetical protein